MARRYNWQSAMNCMKILAMSNGFYARAYDDLYHSKESRKALDNWIKQNHVTNDSDFVVMFEN